MKKQFSFLHNWSIFSISLSIVGIILLICGFTLMLTDTISSNDRELIVGVAIYVAGGAAILAPFLINEPYK